MDSTPEKDQKMPSFAAENLVSYIFIKMPQELEFKPSSITIDKVSYLMIRASRIFIDQNSEISANGAGCTSESPKIDSQIGKYVKVCKVKGGSNIGRGSLGTDINM
jgi:hypothetical protein